MYAIMDRQVAISISFRASKTRSMKTDVERAGCRKPCKAAFNKFIDPVGLIRVLFGDQRGALRMLFCKRITRHNSDTEYKSFTRDRHSTSRVESATSAFNSSAVREIIPCKLQRIREAH